MINYNYYIIKLVQIEFSKFQAIKINASWTKFL